MLHKGRIPRTTDVQSFVFCVARSGVGVESGILVVVLGLGLAPSPLPSPRSLHTSPAPWLGLRKGGHISDVMNPKHLSIHRWVVGGRASFSQFFFFCEQCSGLISLGYVWPGG